jgi:hypothetical protein
MNIKIALRIADRGFPLSIRNLQSAILEVYNAVV